MRVRSGDILQIGTRLGWFGTKAFLLEPDSELFLLYLCSSPSLTVNTHLFSILCNIKFCGKGMRYIRAVVTCYHTPAWT
jgi:hypothetical protein